MMDMENFSDTYFEIYEAYSENEIQTVTQHGIALRNGQYIDFSLCAENYRKLHHIDHDSCIGERDLCDFSFTFYTLPHPKMIRFIKRSRIAEFFSRDNTRQRFYNLQKKIMEYGYRVYDLT